jgi:hypothetical protein
MLRLLAVLTFTLALTAVCHADGGTVERVLRPAQVLSEPDAQGNRTPTDTLIEVDFDPWELEARTTYALELTAWDGDKVVLDTQIATLSGYKGVIRGGATRMRAGSDGNVVPMRQVKSLVVFEAAGNRHPDYTPQELHPAEQALLMHAQRVALGDVTIHLLIPGADRFELKISSRNIPAGRLEVQPGQNRRVMVFAPEQPLYELGTVTGRLSTPELDFEYQVETAGGGNGTRIIMPDGTLVQQ